mmetsp:Transcript_1629/g.3798  ORF Transcript_1629/g.3798 Transcript_1629/m.3798 type:complete len:260 (-) Transcript_1629:517-1296(-)
MLVDLWNHHVNVLSTRKIDEFGNAFFGIGCPLVGIEFPKQLEIAGLPPVVEFFLETSHELVDSACNVCSNQPIVFVWIVAVRVFSARRRNRFDQLGSPPQQLGIFLNDIFYIGSLDLDGHFLAIVSWQNPRIHYANTGCCHGFLRQGCQKFLHFIQISKGRKFGCRGRTIGHYSGIFPPQDLTGTLRSRQPHWIGTLPGFLVQDVHVVLELGKGNGERPRDNVGPRRQGLPELDIGRSQPFKVSSKLFRHLNIATVLLE